MNLLEPGIDSSVLAIRDRYRAEWEDNVRLAAEFVPSSAWSEFERSAVEDSIGAIRLLDKRVGI